MTSFVLRHVRLVEVERGTGHGDQPIHVLVRDGEVAEVGPDVRHPVGMQEYDADGRWLMPGLWDAHVHLDQWVLFGQRLDTGAARSPREAAALVAARLAETEGPLVGWGHRSATWPEQPTTALLDEVAGERPVVLISGDGHHGWLNSAGQRLMGLPPSDGPIAEEPWFAAYSRITEIIPGDLSPSAVQRALDAAAALGVTGMVDFEFGVTRSRWADRVAAGVGGMRIRAATYAEGLDALLAEGLRDGDPGPGTAGLVTTGPLKIISDGSLNTRTAWCCEPYTDRDDVGAPNLDGTTLRDLMTRARDGGLQVAVHAIGDRAVAEALVAFAQVDVPGSIEHAQLVRREDLRQFARLGLVASVQPAHLLDDRVVSEACWTDRTDRCFMLRAMREHRVRLAMGSDAPVSPLDPWLAIRAAVDRGSVDDPWHPEQALSLPEALAASVDGRGTVHAGMPADLLLLDDDPLGEWTGAPRIAATAVGGVVTHGSL